MRPVILTPLLVLGLAASACEDNRAPGNDREAQMASPEPPAELMSLREATEGVASALLLPQPMTEADLGSVPEEASSCFFGYTRVSEPVFAYGSTGVLKVNDKLARVPASGEGRYAESGVTVAVNPVEEPRADGEPFDTQLILRFPDEDHERGMKGYSRCGTPAR